jgi:hypothetical protein
MTPHPRKENLGSNCQLHIPRKITTEKGHYDHHLYDMVASLLLSYDLLSSRY